MQIDCHVYDFIGTLLGGDVVGRMWGFNWHLVKEGSVAIAGPAGFKSISNVTIIIGRSLLACQTLWSGSMNRVGGFLFYWPNFGILNNIRSLKKLADYFECSQTN